MDEAPAESQVIASWDDAEVSDEGQPRPAEPAQSSPSNGDSSNGLGIAGPSRPCGSLPAASTAGPSPSQGTSVRARMRPNASVLQQLLAVHKEDSLRAAKAEKRRHRLQAQMLRLQKEMMDIVKNYFAARANKDH